MRLHLVYGALARLAFISYGVWQDQTTAFKYTDIDYKVFSDAARYIARPSDGNEAQGLTGHLLPLGDPYKRATYRYTPLLALVLTPNELLHPLFGKVLFGACDLLISYILIRMLSRSRIANATLLVNLIWLFNPMVINISTRGSSEALLGVIVVGCMYAVTVRRMDLGAVLLGLAVHVKIYPLIYTASIMSSMADHRSPLSFLQSLFSKRVIRFAAISLATFASLTGLMYLVWGQPFIQHAYLYHLSRLDHRHNFSPAFYPIYLSSDSEATVNPLAGFVPQMGLSLVLGVLFGKEDQPFAWFIQTFAFVTLNKVVTSQYFLWYLWFLPLVIPTLQISGKEGIGLLAVWVASQAVWLKFAYDLEMLGKPVQFQLWSASILFITGHLGVLGFLIRRHRSLPLQKQA